MNDNTPAFPMARVTVLAEDGTPNEGIPLRDYFAGQVLAGYLATGFPDEGLDHVSMDENDIAIARHCYALADAMLKVRGE